MTPAPAPSVLIADADPYICRVFEAKLVKEHAFRTVSVTSGREALTAASRNVFAAILWDLRLRDSVRLLPRIRALCPSAALVLLTTDDRPTLDGELALLDVADILVKPLSLDTLVERVHAAVDGPKARALSGAIEIARVGQRVEMASPLDRCVTRVLENRYDTFTVVGAPRVHIPRDFRAGLRIRAWVAGEDAAYSFATRLIRAVEDPVSGWELEKPRIIRREQRRRHARQPLSFAISIEPRGPHAGDEEGRYVSRFTAGGAGLVGQTEDLGIGGCALVSKLDIPAGTSVDFILQAPLEPPITGHGTVVRTAPSVRGIAQHSDAGHRIALKFNSLTPAVRRRLRAVLDPTR